ncbi:hypothetical protein [Halalkalibaculum sp. DA384]|uniref:hypothetical protein n=1 Tax=Halalkalibaculum sp. DA384 TaxID=3373606 RepID=UPI0037540081
MSTEIVGVIAACIGALITGLFNWIRSTDRTDTDDRIQFRADILDRLKVVEARTKHLEEEVTIWKIRYWSLYAQSLQQYDISPPEFHEMDLQDLEKSYREAIEKLNQKR